MMIAKFLRWPTAIASVALLLSSGCGMGVGTGPATRPEHAASAPGSIVEVKPFADIDASVKDLGAEALHALYRSTSSDGAHTVVSGTLFVPAGKPPPGGWITLAIAHGTTGITPECAPSRSPNMLGQVALVTKFLKEGYAIAFADYQGLGAPGIHEYLNSRTEAYNVIDSVRALRNARPGVISDRWLVFGGSQGGGASWAAAEEAPVYAPEMHLLGAVNAVPAANISGYAQMAEDGSMTPFQSAAYSALIISQGRAHPDLDLDLYRRGSVKANEAALIQCQGPGLQDRARAVKEIKPEELKPANHAATLALKARLESMAVAKRKTDVPMLVIYAGKDEYIKPEWTRQAIEDACKLGTKIEVDFEADRSHGTFDYTNIIPWLHDRVEGKPLKNPC
ncbi:MAG TPA: lipase family protein [Rudaea sp.]